MTHKKFTDVYRNLLGMISKKTMNEREKLEASLWKEAVRVEGGWNWHKILSIGGLWH
jgi:hypothetical protein